MAFFILLLHIDLFRKIPPVLSFREFVPRLEFLTLFRDIRKSMKMSYFRLFFKSYLVLFLTFIMAF